MRTDVFSTGPSGRDAAVSRRATRVMTGLSAWDLAGSQLMAGANSEVLLPLLDICQIQHLPAGEALLSPGQINSSLYLILDGRVRVHQGSGDSATTAVLGSGEMVCDLSVIDNRTVTISAMAETAAHVLVINRAMFWTLVEASHAVARNMLALLNERLRRGNVAAARAERLHLACERNRPAA
jgi:CRP-like cAMP-binding protein